MFPLENILGRKPSSSSSEPGAPGDSSPAAGSESFLPSTSTSETVALEVTQPPINNDDDQRVSHYDSDDSEALAERMLMPDSETQSQPQPFSMVGLELQDAQSDWDSLRTFQSSNQYQYDGQNSEMDEWRESLSSTPKPSGVSIFRVPYSSKGKQRAYINKEVSVNFI
jgi:hypothetical protein